MKRKLMLIFISLSMIALSSQAQELVEKNGGYGSELTKDFSVSPGGKLVIKNVTADVSVNTWEKNTVSVTEHVMFHVYTREEAEERIARWQQRYQQEGNTITIRGNSDFECDNCKLDIKVPVKFNLEIGIANGDIEISGLEGNVMATTSGGDIDMGNITGKLEIRTSGGDLDFDKISGTLNAVTSGGDVSLRNIFAESDIVTSGGDIDLVNGTQRMSLRTSGGDIDIKNVSGILNMTTSGGDIEVMDYTGPKLNFSTSGGDIEMANIKGEVNANTSGGDIEARTFESRTVVQTSGGDIDLKDVRSALAAKTVGGDISADMQITDFSAPHDVTLETNGGNITLFIPAKLPATIDAELRLNDHDRQWQRYDIYSDFPLTKTMPNGNGNQILKCTGDINGGGDPIVLRTQGGNIYIKKH